jgi:hypothetical protein
LIFQSGLQDRQKEVCILSGSEIARTGEVKEREGEKIAPYPSADLSYKKGTRRVPSKTRKPIKGSKKARFDRED